MLRPREQEGLRADAREITRTAALQGETRHGAGAIRRARQALPQRRAPIKQVLLAGDIVVGVGNIYASEALFKAGIRPTTAACRISKPRAARLHGAIVQVLTRALEVGGSTLRDFSNARGESGYFQLEMSVYDRAGQPCTHCQTPIRQIRQGQRSTFFCPSCQKP